MENELKEVLSQKMVRIENMKSPRSNREVPNQFIIYTSDATIFQSYGSIIALITKGKTYLDSLTWDYSKTTGKYRNNFLGESKKETEQKIKNGEYVLTQLNFN